MIRLTSAAVPPTQPQRGLDALGAELAGVKRPAQLVEFAQCLLVHELPRHLEQDQVARPAQLAGPGHERLTRGGAHVLQPEHHRQTALKAFTGCQQQQLLGPLLDLLRGHAALQQLQDPGSGQHARAVVDQALEEGLELLGGGAADDQQAAGRVAQPVARRQNAGVDAQVGGPRLAAVAAGAVRGVAGALVLTDLDAASWGSAGHRPPS